MLGVYLLHYPVSTLPPMFLFVQSQVDTHTEFSGIQGLSSIAVLPCSSRGHYFLWRSQATHYDSSRNFHRRRWHLLGQAPFQTLLHILTNLILRSLRKKMKAQRLQAPYNTVSLRQGPWDSEWLNSKCFALPTVINHHRLWLESYVIEHILGHNIHLIVVFLKSDVSPVSVQTPDSKVLQWGLWTEFPK